MTNAEKREKVTKALECCVIHVSCSANGGCPYKQSGGACLDVAIKDTLALLKTQEAEAIDAPKPDSDIGCWYDITHSYTLEQVVSALKAQEPRVMMLEEVAALPDGSIVWLEDNDKPDVIVGLLRDVLLTANDHIVVVIHFAIVRNQLLEVVTAMADDYGIRWRCWTSRPADEVREATPWTQTNGL